MKFDVKGSEYEKGLKDFLKVYYKEEIKKGSLRNCLVAFIISLSILVLFCFMLSGMKEIFLRIIYFVIFVMFIIVVGIFISLFISKRKEYDIEKVEQIYGDSINIKEYKNNGKIYEKNFEYEDVLKVVETKEYFYLFLNEAVAFPLYKDIYLKREEYIDFIKSKGIKIKEYVKWLNIVVKNIKC